MAQVYAEDLVAYVAKHPQQARNLHANYNAYAYPLPPAPPVYNLVVAEGFVAKLREQALSNTQRCKANRPWTFVDFSKLVDPKEAWLGFEYETGFDDQKDYEKAIAFLWDKQKYNAIDREGSGAFPFEIAFPPASAADFRAGATNVQNYFDFLQKNKLKQSNEPTTYSRRAIGMHVNISTPKSRKSGRQNGHIICTWLNTLSKNEQIELFGRYQQHWSLAQNRETWIEFKCFHSTDDKKAFDGYVQVALRFVDLIDFSIDNKGKAPTNLYAFLSGKDEALKVGK